MSRAPQEEGRSEKNGYVPDGASEVRKVPLEVYVQGDKAPIYGATFDDDGRPDHRWGERRIHRFAV